MTRNEQDLAALSRACCGNREAMGWLELWRLYVHAIDDVVDTAMPAEGKLYSYILAWRLYTHPFFLRNIAALRAIVLNCTNAYADTVAWEKAPHQWQREFADHYRHYGAEMVLAVAGLCAEQAGQDPYLHLRSISLELRTVCYLEHHDVEGNPI